LWATTPYSLLKINRRFGGSCRRISRAKKKKRESRATDYTPLCSRITLQNIACPESSQGKVVCHKWSSALWHRRHILLSRSYQTKRFHIPEDYYIRCESYVNLCIVRPRNMTNESCPTWQPKHWHSAAWSHLSNASNEVTDNYKEQQ
jgi:hypothetical protein